MKIMDKLDWATENELELFSEINHNNIVKYYDHFHMRIEGENQTFLITEYCKVSGWDIIKSQLNKGQ
jgi:serine/threonine protein kinase